jgi:uncharacterized protein
MARRYTKLFGALVATSLMALAGAAAAATYEDGLLAYDKSDYATALKIFRPLAERGDIRSENALGRMYIRGEGVARDPAEGTRWFKQATDQTKALDAYNSGDFALALKTFRPLAEKGQVLGQYILGLMYTNGQGVAENFPEGLQWLTKAAEQGEAKAQFSVGVIYFKGLGVTKNNTEALKWYRRAAEQGNPPAQYNLGAMYAKGEPVAQDNVTAYMLYALAAAQGIRAAGDARDKLAKSMSLDQVVEANKKVHAWKPKLETD